MLEGILDPNAFYDHDPNPRIFHLCRELIQILDQRELSQDRQYELIDCEMKKSLSDFLSGDAWSSVKITSRYRPSQTCEYLLDERGGILVVCRGNASSLSRIAIPRAYDHKLRVKFVSPGWDSDSRYELSRTMRRTRLLRTQSDTAFDRLEITQDLRDALRAFASHLPPN
jgi:hypothetical protein